MIIEYDGAAFAGWQTQEGEDAPPTVQGALEEALKAFSGDVGRVRGASRTDAGVHARGQVAAFETHRDNIPVLGFQRGLRRHLPPDIVVRKAEEVSVGWDPRRSSRGKRYIYSFWNDSSPTALERGRTWWVRKPLDIDAMRAAAHLMLGTHDFEAFRAVGCVAKHAVRTIYELEIRRGPAARVDLIVVGNAFVRNMVRIIAGTLAEVGQGRRTAHDVERALEVCQRSSAGVTAPAWGLCLDEVIYDARLPERPKDNVDTAKKRLN